MFKGPLPICSSNVYRSDREIACEDVPHATKAIEWAFLRNSKCEDRH
jgi:hypothetical protein